MKRMMMNVGTRRLLVFFGMGLLFLAGVSVAAYQNSAHSRGISTVELGMVDESSVADVSEEVVDCLDMDAPGRTPSSMDDGVESTLGGMGHPGTSASSAGTSRDDDASTAPDSASSPSSSSPQESQRPTAPETSDDDGDADDTNDDDAAEDPRPPHHWSPTEPECPGL